MTVVGSIKNSLIISLLVIILLRVTTHLAAMVTLVVVRSPAVGAVVADAARAADAAAAAHWMTQTYPFGRLAVIRPESLF